MPTRIMTEREKESTPTEKEISEFHQEENRQLYEMLDKKDKEIRKLKDAIVKLALGL